MTPQVLPSDSSFPEELPSSGTAIYLPLRKPVPDLLKEVVLALEIILLLTCPSWGSPDKDAVFGGAYQGFPCPPLNNWPCKGGGVTLRPAHFATLPGLFL